jgi:hypothetical protein
MLCGDPGPMRSRSGIEPAFIPRSWRGFVQPRMGRRFIAWRRPAPGDPQRTNDHLELPKGAAAGIAGRVAAGAGWPGRTEVLRFRRWAWVCHLRPFRCKHRIMHRKRGPGQQGLRVGANLLGRNLDGNQIAWKYRACAGHADLLFRDGVKRQAGTVIAYY